MVTVNDSLEVESVDWRPLDVVRWASLDVSLSGLEDDEAATKAIRDALVEALDSADNRLLAVRVTLTGATALHGSLHREADRWRAEIRAMAQDFGEDVVWIEQIKIATTSIYELAQLAERDALTKVVLETLENAGQELDTLPADITEMLGVLPPEVRQEVEREWEADQRDRLIQDVRAIILESLATKERDEA